MSESKDNERRANPPETSEWNSDIVFEEYWSDLSSDASLDPKAWLDARRGDPALGSQLQILSALRNAPPQFAARLSQSAGGGPTDGQALSTSQPGSSARKRVPCLLPGELIDGKLRVLAELGAGGMGEVYVAWHQALDREVALKVLPSHQAQDEEAVARFRRSIALHAKTGGHPNIVGVMDAGQHNGQMYLVMEYVAGIDLARLCHMRQAIPWREACDWMRQTAIGLHQAHQRSLFHRDVKPANLIRAQDGTIKLLDWGLVRGERPSSAAPGEEVTKEFVGMGTADYISPEQSCDAATADAKSDLYSLGCTFYHLLVGKPPFAHHKTNTAKIVAHSAERPPPLGAARPDVPVAVEDLVDRLLEKDPRRRPDSARDVADQLELLIDREAPAPRSPWPNRIAAAALLLAAVALGYVLWPKSETSTGPTGGAPQWERLELIVAPQASDPAQSYDPAYFVVKDGRRQEDRPIRVLKEDSAFRIEGRLSAPAPWVVAWIDTAGKFSLEDSHGKGEGAEVSYPSSAGFVTVNPNDPPGVHLILVLVGDKTSGEDRTIGERTWKGLQALAAQNWTPPPNVPSGAWLNIHDEVDEPGDWRGPRQPLLTPAPAGTVEMHTQRSYLELIESKLPPGVAPRAGFFLRTGP